MRASVTKGTQHSPGYLSFLPSAPTAEQELPGQQQQHPPTFLVRAGPSSKAKCVGWHLHPESHHRCKLSDPPPGSKHPTPGNSQTQPLYPKGRGQQAKKPKHGPGWDSAGRGGCLAGPASRLSVHWLRSQRLHSKATPLQPGWDCGDSPGLAAGARGLGHDSCRGQASPPAPPVRPQPPWEHSQVCECGSPPCGASGCPLLPLLPVPLLLVRRRRFPRGLNKDEPPQGQASKALRKSRQVDTSWARPGGRPRPPHPPEIGSCACPAGLGLGQPRVSTGEPAGAQAPV